MNASPRPVAPLGRTVREPVAAGTFYPGRPGGLGTLVDRLLSEAATSPRAGLPQGLIVPHAGYGFSGPVAASAYLTLAQGRESLRRVVVFGPAHFVDLEGAAAPRADAWRTPLGEVPIDDELRVRAAAWGSDLDDRPHEDEHSIEVQLPFLQRVLAPGFSVLPLAVGLMTAARGAHLVEVLSADPDTLVVASTDLSHYHDQETARALDRRTAQAVVDRAPERIGPSDACGVFALRGVVEHARRRALTIGLLDLRNSADTAGDPRRVVGYGAFAIG